MRRMEDKIRDLCAKVVASKNDGDITPKLVGFRVALHPHVERLRAQLVEYPVVVERRKRPPDITGVPING